MCWGVGVMVTERSGDNPAQTLQFFKGWARPVQGVVGDWEWVK